MKSFREFIIEAGHLRHLEDEVLYGGVKGARRAIESLRATRDRLTGASNDNNLSITCKFDGAPAIFCGIDPSDSKFFVAKKSIFNKDPEVYKTPQDINSKIESGDLNNKLQIALKELSKLGIQGIIQGDIMFTSEMLKKERIQGKDYITFHPNTIVYAIPTDSKLASQISKASIGVVFHTSYKGKLGSLTPVAGVNTSKMKQIPSVWWITADMSNPGSKDKLTPEQLKEVNEALSEAGKIFQKISSTTLKAIEMDPDLARDLETFNNTKVRKGEEIGDPVIHVNQLLAWMKARFDNEEKDKKSSKGKEAVSARRKARMAFFSSQNTENLILIYRLQGALVKAKRLLISKLDKQSDLNTFLKTKDGYQNAGQEGFVVANKLTGNTVKLVDRMSFSKANFSADVQKGWQR